MSDPTTCPVCKGTACNAEAHLPAVRIRALERTVHAQAARLAEVEARLPVVAKPRAQCDPRCGTVQMAAGWWPENRARGVQFCTAPCADAGRPLNPAPPPSAGPTTGNAPVLANSPVCQPNAPLSTSPAFVNQPAPVASGASVPDGFVLGDGWEASTRNWTCTHRADGEFDCYADDGALWERPDDTADGSCARHAVEMGALVKVEGGK